jgi:hypothetical protein
MEEGEGLEALRKQLDEKEKELEEAKTKAVEEGKAQIAKALKLVEEKGILRFRSLPSFFSFSSPLPAHDTVALLIGRKQPGK